MSIGSGLNQRRKWLNSGPFEEICGSTAPSGLLFSTKFVEITVSPFRGMVRKDRNQFAAAV